MTGLLDSQDTRMMCAAWRKLGIRIEGDLDAGAVRVSGCRGQIPHRDVSLFVENSGTTIRFLTGVLGIAGGRYQLDGNARMRQRPIGPLVEALQSLGCNVRAAGQDQYPPVEIDSANSAGGAVSLSGDLSSQYLSGLMLAGPLARGNLHLNIVGPLVSKPYVEMTREVMRAFGVAVKWGEDDHFAIAADQAYQGIDYSIEPDASAASYFWAIPAILGGTARIDGLTQSSIQGDVQFVEALRQMGCRVRFESQAIIVEGPAKRGIEIDLSDFSDTAQTLAVVSLFVRGPTTIRGIAHNRLKETDRIADLGTELRKLGAQIEEFDDRLTIQPPKTIRPARIATYDDHRMAMSLALVGLRTSGIEIENPSCVAKTYPHFFDDLSRVLGDH